jgi:glycosyltransferase involved in cell wall biosynthesis
MANVGIYNRWLATMGGGEQVMGAIARSLSRHNKVEILSHVPVDLNELRDHLGMDLRGIPLRIVPYEPGYHSIKLASADYDLFVNCSHLDIFAAQAPLNAMYVYFPGPLPEAGPRPSRARLTLLSGFQGLEFTHGTHFRWTSNNARLLLRGLSPKSSFTLRLALGSFRPSAASLARIRLYLNNEKLGSDLSLPREGVIILRQEIPSSRIHDEQMILRIESTTFNRAAFGERDSRTLGVAVFEADLDNNFPLGRLRQRVSRPTRVSRLRQEWTARSNTEDELDRYQLLFGVSRYTQLWIRERWKRPSRLLYPLVPVEQFTPRAKRPQIISVGRFFRGSHNKKHIPLIQAFRELCDAGLTGWHYHLVGGTHDEPEHREYLCEVRAAAKGYPITIHADLDFRELQTLYGESRIYWNATGWDEDEQTLPEAFEHFGITTVEAMASGCVPVSFARAGQPEIVRHGNCGFLWNDFRECQSFTRQLIADEYLWECMSGAALERSRCFAEGMFEQSLAHSLGWLVESHAGPTIRLLLARVTSGTRPAGEERLTDTIDLGFSEVRARR